MENATDFIFHGREARSRGDRDAARAGYSRAAELYLAEGLTLSWAHAVRHVADMWLEEEQLDEARTLYQQALNAYRGSLETRILDLSNTVRPYALLNEVTGQTELARSLWLEAKTLYAAIRIDEGVAECEKHLVILSRSNQTAGEPHSSP